MESEKTGLSSPTDLFSKSWNDFLGRAGLYVSILLLPLVLALLLLLPGVLSAPSQIPGVWFVLGIAVSLVYVLSQVALILAVVNPHLTLSQAYKDAVSKFPSYLWITIVSGLVVFGGLLLFIIPGLVISVMISFAIFVYFDEDKRGLSALVRSKEYVKGRGWAVFGRLLFLAVVFGLIGIGVQFLLAQTPYVFLDQLVAELLGLILTPLGTLYAYNLYRELKTSAKFETSEEGTASSKKWFAFLSLLGIVSLFVLPAIVFSALLALGFDQEKLEAYFGPNSPHSDLYGLELDIDYVPDALDF